MKMRNIFTIAAAISTAAVLAVSAAAYDLNKDLSTFWSASVTVPGGEFADHNAENYIKVTYTADKSLTDMEGHNYWCIKPMINDSGWPLIAGIEELDPTEDGSAYDVDPDATSITFSIPEDQLEHVQLAGIAFMGHGITLETIEITSEAPVADTPAAPETSKGNPDTGVESVATVAAIAALGAGTMFISRKRK